MRAEEVGEREVPARAAQRRLDPRERNSGRPDARLDGIARSAQAPAHDSGRPWIDRASQHLYKAVDARLT